jgi:RNA polymerase sigma factor (sigma-70 family)
MLDELMRSDGRQLWRRARRFTVNDQDADDALEDACVAFLRSFRAEPQGSAAAWMMTTVKYAALAITERNSVLRRRATTDAPDEVDEWWESAVRDPAASTEERVEDRQWVAACSAALAELKPDERTALSLIAFGLSYKEVAERQGWSATKTNRCAAEGRARLRELLSLRGEKT